MVVGLVGGEKADSLGLKIKSDTDWNGTNETGFNGLNGYARDPNGWFFFSAGYYAEGGVWWAAEDGVNGGFNRYVHTEEAGIYRSPFADANWGLLYPMCKGLTKFR